MAAGKDIVEPRTYGYWRRPVSVGLGRFGMLSTLLLLSGLIVVILTSFFVGLVAGLALLIGLALVLSTLWYRDQHHRTLMQRIGVRLGWWWTRHKGAHLYRSGPLGRVPWGTCQLPGLLAASELTEQQDSYNRPFALLRVPRVGHYSIAFRQEPDGESLVDQEQIDSWVAHWGNWLASLADEPDVLQAMVTVETAPDSGVRLRRAISGRIDPEAPEVAKSTLNEIMDVYPAGAATVRAWTALTFDARAGGSGRFRNEEEMASDLATRIAGLGQRLQATGAGATHPVTAQGLCETVRIAYDPPAARLIDQARAAGHNADLRWGDVGPTAHEVAWSHYHHDGGWSVTWAMSVPPRSAVQASVLARLLAPHPAIDRKRVTLVYRPFPAAVAAEVAERDKLSAQHRAQSGLGAARHTADSKAAAAIAVDEASGSGVVNFSLLVTATVTDRERLRDAIAAVDNLAATARIKLRPVYGSMDSAFAAALPLGLITTAYLRTPAAIREAI